MGIVGAPIPDEIVVMSGGFVSSLDILQIIPAFVVTYLGVVSGLSLGYVLGKLFGTKILNKLIRKKKNKYFEASRKLILKYGNRALIFSYFFPVVRHIVPYIVGINGMPFKTYALYSYTAGFFWTLLYFILGIFFGQHMKVIAAFATKYGIVAAIIIVILLIILYFYRKWKTKLLLKDE
nr:DedA family protein [Sporosarcina limicola]